MNQYEGNFTEHDIKLLCKDRVGVEVNNIKVIRRHGTVNGYMALVSIYGQYIILFISFDFNKEKYELPSQVCMMAIDLNELEAIKQTEAIVHIIGAWEI